MTSTSHALPACSAAVDGSSPLAAGRLAVGTRQFQGSTLHLTLSWRGWGKAQGWWHPFLAQFRPSSCGGLFRLLLRIICLYLQGLLLHDLQLATLRLATNLLLLSCLLRRSEDGWLAQCMLSSGTQSSPAAHEERIFAGAHWCMRTVQDRSFGGNRPQSSWRVRDSCVSWAAGHLLDLAVDIIVRTLSVCSRLPALIGWLCASGQCRALV